MKTIKLYLAGPMTGITACNYPAFNELAAALRAYPELTVLNPAENEAPADPTWQNWMRLSLKQLIDADAVIMLKGWGSSKGALEELRTARTLELPVLYEAYGLEPQVSLLIAGKLK